MKHTIVFRGSQFTRCIPLSQRVAKIKHQAGFFVFYKFTLHVQENLGDKSGGIDSGTIVSSTNQEGHYKQRS